MASLIGVVEEPPRAPAVDAVRRAWAAAGASERAVTFAAGVVALVAAVTWSTTVSPLVAIAAGTTVALLVPAALVDVAERRLPNGIVVAASGPAFAAAVWSAWSRDAAAWGVGWGAVLVAIPLLATHLVSPAGLGFGDVKAGAVLGGGLGLLSPVVSAAALVVGLGLTAIVALATGRRTVALGPGLVAGAIAALIGGRLLDVTPW